MWRRLAQQLRLQFSPIYPPTKCVSHQDECIQGSWISFKKINSWSRVKVKGWFLSERFQGIDFRSLHQVFPLLGMKINMSILLCAKRDFFLGTFCRRMLWDAAEGHSQDKKDSRKYWVTINRFDFSLGLYQGPSGFTLIAPCRSQGRGGRRIADWTRITSLVSVNGLFQPIGNKNKSEIYNGVFFCFWVS